MSNDFCIEKPNYYAILPARVRYSSELTDFEKLLYAEITALTQKNGYCYAKNRYFEALFNKSKSTIQRSIAHLKELGFLEVEIIYKDGTKEIQDRLIFIQESVKEKAQKIVKNDTTPHSKNDTTPHSKNDTHNNINNKYTRKNIKKENPQIEICEEKNPEEKPTSKKKFIKPTLEDLISYKQEKNLNVDCESFYDYYEAKGWMIGRSPMKDWQATMRNWSRNQEAFNPPKQQTEKNYEDDYEWR